jgi:hypothetical protein
MIPLTLATSGTTDFPKATTMMTNLQSLNPNSEPSSSPSSPTPLQTFSFNQNQNQNLQNQSLTLSGQQN